MKRIMVAFLVLAFLAAMLIGCSMAADKSNEAADNIMAAGGKQPVQETAARNDAEEKAFSGSGGIVQKDESDGGISAYNAILAQRKVIFNSNITVEVENFNESYGKILTIISGNGFVQNSKVTRDRYYDEEDNEKFITRGVIVIRVAREKFDVILSSIKGLGTVLDDNLYTDDVTDRYFDTEARLRVLELEEEKLISYLKKIEDPETIFKYERRLTEIRQDIESLTGTLRKWDNLVDLSTITINLREKQPEKEEEEKEEKPYWKELADKFASSVKGTVRFLGNFIIFLAQALPVLFLLGIIAGAAYAVLRVIRKFLKKSGDDAKSSKPVKQENNGR